MISLTIIIQATVSLLQLYSYFLTALDVHFCTQYQYKNGHHSQWNGGCQSSNTKGS